jgi:hypothetical protein
LLNPSCRRTSSSIIARAVRLDPRHTSLSMTTCGTATNRPARR